MCGIGSCQVPMAIGSANQPEASGQFPLAKLVAERRREMGLALAEVARLMDKAAVSSPDRTCWLMLLRHRGHSNLTGCALSCVPVANPFSN